MIAEYQVDMTAARRQGQKRKALLGIVEPGRAVTTTKGVFGYKKEAYGTAKEGHDEMMKSIRFALDYDGEAGLDELLRRNGIDPKKFDRKPVADKKTRPLTSEQISSQKRIDAVKTKRDNLLLQAQAIKNTPTATTPDEAKSSSPTSSAAQNRNDKFSEKALLAKPRASVFDLATGGGTFSGYEMGNLGGNMLTKMMGDLLSVQRGMKTALDTLVEEVQEGGGFG